MSKKLTVLSAARSLPRFTVTELGERLGIPPGTVQTVLNRVPEHWFTKSQLQSGARGGQHKSWEVTDEGRRAVDALLADLGVAPASAHTTVGAGAEAPLGLLAAEEIRHTLETADPRAIPGLLADAAANLAWADDELAEHLYVANADALLRRMAVVRKQLRTFEAGRVPEAAAEPARGKSIVAMARERIVQLGSAFNNAVFTPAPPFQVVIGCLGSGDELRNLAVVARATLNGAAQARHATPVACVMQNVALEEIDTTFMEDWVAEPVEDNQGLVWCINSAEDDGSIQRMLEHRRSAQAGRPAVVLDVGFSPAVETVAHAAQVAYAPYAGDGQSAAWVSNFAM